MKSQFEFLPHIDDGGLPMHSEKFFSIYSYAKNVLVFILLSLKCFFKSLCPKEKQVNFSEEWQLTKSTETSRSVVTKTGNDHKSPKNHHKPPANNHQRPNRPFPNSNYLFSFINWK